MIEDWRKSNNDNVDNIIQVHYAILSLFVLYVNADDLSELKLWAYYIYWMQLNEQSVGECDS